MPIPLTTVADDALGELDLVALVAALRSGAVSADEVRAAAIARARLADSTLNAITCWVPGIEQRSGRASGSGALSGVPTLLKDNENLAGMPTTFGSRAVTGDPARSTSRFARQMAEMGLEIIAKTSLPEFGLTASTESSALGATANPWHPGHSPGGSSGGSAALVAAGVVPIAHGNDGGGSIRIPASCCGLVGLKPSRGRLAQPANMRGLPVDIAVQGAATRTVGDTALFLAEAERFQRVLRPVGRVEGPSARRLRIAVTTRGPLGQPVDPQVKEATDRAAEVCAGLGHHVTEVERPFSVDFARDFFRYWAALALFLRAAGRRTLGPGFRPRELELFTLGLADFCQQIVASIPATIIRLRRFPKTYARVFDSCDVLLSPTLAQLPPPLGHLGPDVDFRTHFTRLVRLVGFTPAQNVAGAPAISLPLAASAQGLPIGIQAAAAFGDERTLLELAYELESAMPWPRGTAGSAAR